MDFGSEVRKLLAQIPRDRVARCADLARALGDVRATAAVARYLRVHRDLPGARRVLTSDGRFVVPASTPAEGDLPSFDAFASENPLAALRAEQVRFAARVSRQNGFREVRTVAGIDLAYDGDRGFASLVVLRVPDLAVVDQVDVAAEIDFPYIPTYLAYRELPLIEAAFERVREKPTILLIDGHGQLHPARCGIACMAGLRLGVPTIGVAKNPLVGAPDHRPKIGEAVPVRDDGDVLGYAVRPTASVKPLYVSVGHRVALRTAVRIVRELCRTRHPEPLRLADLRASKMKREKGKRF